MNSLRPHVFAAFVFLVFASYRYPAAQAPPSQPKSATTDYVDEASVVERDEVIYRYVEDGTGSRTETAAVRVQSGAALQTFGVLTFPYASATQGLEIVYARVRKADGSTVETPATDVQDQPAPATQLAPMYSDLHIKQLPMRSLAVGDTVEFETRLTIKQAEVPGEFWGAENFGVGMVYLDRRIELHVPKQKTVAIYSPDFTPDISELGEERTISVERRAAQAQQREGRRKCSAGQDATYLLDNLPKLESGWGVVSGTDCRS